MRPPRRTGWWLLAMAAVALVLGRRRRTPAQRAEDLRWRWM
ncbi:MAG: hypothetical protein R2761_20890 [Acidimicrobiales bacterium]